MAAILDFSVSLESTALAEACLKRDERASYEPLDSAIEKTDICPARPRARRPSPKPATPAICQGKAEASRFESKSCRTAGRAAGAVAAARILPSSVIITGLESEWLSRARVKKLRRKADSRWLIELRAAARVHLSSKPRTAIFARAGTMASWFTSPNERAH